MNYEPPEIILSLAGENLVSPPADTNADWLELRLDTLPEMALPAAMAIVSRLGAGNFPPLLATLRHSAETGLWSGDEEKRLKWYRHLAPEVARVDVELHADIAAEVVKIAGRERALLSWHGAFRTFDPEAALERCRMLGATRLKLAVEVETMEQLGTLLDWQRRHRAPPSLTTLGMGRLGRLSRMLCLLQGSVAGYAFPDGSKALASGQLPLSELRGRLRRHGALFDGRGRPEEHPEELHQCLADFLSESDPSLSEVLSLLAN